MIMRTAYRVIAYLLALSVAVQTSLIAFGAFALENNIDNGPVSDGDTTGVTLHHSFAYVVVLFAVALLTVSFGAKVQHGVRWAAIPLGLVVVQFFLAYAAYSAAIVGVLHGLNALAIFAVALLAGRRVAATSGTIETSHPARAAPRRLRHYRLPRCRRWAERLAGPTWRTDRSRPRPPPGFSPFSATPGCSTELRSAAREQGASIPDVSNRGGL
jgi:hypothetical protein